MEIATIREYVSNTYPNGGEEIPQELLEACELELLYEATKRDVQLKVYFKQAFDALLHKEWDVKSIDKEIKKIEKCNRFIEEAQEKFILSPKYFKLNFSMTYFEQMIKEGFYGFIINSIGNLLGGPFIGSLAKVFYDFYRTYDIKPKKNGKDHLVCFEKLRQENEKALKWLKEERERILNGTAKKKKLGNIITGKQESANIFDSIELL